MRRRRDMDEQQRAAIAIVLTWASGFVDALGYLALVRVFVANMSGNSIAIGEGLARGEWGDVWRRGLAVPMFFLGLLISRAVVYGAKRARIERVGAFLFSLVAVLLLLFAILGQPIVRAGAVPTEPLSRFLLLVALPSIAMGIQNATLTQFGILTVRTTHVTGNLAVLADRVAEHLLWMVDRTRGRGLSRLVRVIAVTPRRRAARAAGLLTLVWIGYVAGGVMGVVAMMRFGLYGVAFPIFAYAALVISDLRRPVIEPAELRRESRMLSGKT